MTRDDLTLAMQNGLNPKWLFFWGHTPPKNGGVSKTCFSQWWEGHPFSVDGITYLTAEHYMMAGKARLFEDEKTHQEILNSKHPADAKKLGRQVSNFDGGTWNKNRVEIVVDGNTAKFGQHPQLHEFLLGTTDRILVEASPRDLIWGIGLGAENPKAQQPWNWRGPNLLGFALMEVRDQLNQS